MRFLKQRLFLRKKSGKYKPDTTGFRWKIVQLSKGNSELLYGDSVNPSAFIAMNPTSRIGLNESLCFIWFSKSSSYP